MRIVLCLLLLSASLLGQSRIVSTSPAITETLFALGAGDRVIAISTHCHFPPQARKLPRIGTYLQPNVEAIVRLRPDLVFMERLPNQAIAQLEQFGVKVQKVPTGDLQTNQTMIQTIATAIGNPQAGQALQQRVKEGLQAVAKQAKGKTPKRVIFIVGRTPGKLEGMVAVGKGSYLNELLAIAGGQNLFADSPVGYAKVSLEAILRLKPDVILDMGEMAETEGITEEQKRKVVQLWKSQPGINGKVTAIADDIFVVPGPRMVDAAREFLQLLHGKVQ